MSRHTTGHGETRTWTPEAGADLEPAVARPGAFSLLVSSAAGMQVFRLDPGDVKVIGRASPADLVFEDRSLSRRHARLSWRPDGVRVEDLGSKNGTLLAGAHISNVLLPGDSARQLRLGQVFLTVHRQLDAALPAFDNCERFLARLEEELFRARTLQRPLSLLMLRATAGSEQSSVALRVRRELRAVDSMAQYAPGVWLVLAPELGLAEAVSAARWLLREKSQLVCGVASSESPAETAHSLIAAVSGACRAAGSEQPIVSACAEHREPQPNDAPEVLCPSTIALYEIAPCARSPEVSRARAQPLAAANVERRTFADQVRDVERDLIRDALRSAGNNQTQAARLLDMPLRTLVYKIRAYGLRKANADAPEERD